ncbi:hypothetical protein Pmar_PMAR023457 [Perkinsus marinus ATCC 50983]|uniref:Uncharacterized protein n=1 Tax=Perkinsus marinus (strain ATCC 50983 / TXsc) TaxID=423536 RepID=C5KKL9_PERM5|nr:hypothetical protein Pmar_PMAR023457 [Perkinsus marinus ATCC 50983]EER15131.1 hypothetical protein Pmar_PMAR023457 [Perkinsus marinus ATCC 50983]|eukprot:XP_002783335.1 hypothetical protein Pmar_PMAR023457 [Perkinsus marinus ATCC 50983]
MSAVAVAPASLGFHAPGLITGTIIFAVLGVVFTFVAPILFAKETPKITKGESKHQTLHPPRMVNDYLHVDVLGIRLHAPDGTPDEPHP